VEISEYRLVPCSTETEELDSENLVGIPWRLEEEEVTRKLHSGVS
jgi:hypothetical protein